MPVVADVSYQNHKAGGALENAAEEILNGIFCHYEPPTSTKAQQNAARDVRKNPTKFLYDEQPTKPLLKKKAVATAAAAAPTTTAFEYESGTDYDTDTDIGEYEEEDEGTLEDPEEEMLFKVEPETPSKRGIKWRDEESKRLEKEKANAKAASRWSECMTLPCFTTEAGEMIPGTLEDIHDENEIPQEPTPNGASTPTKSALKKSDDGVMKVLYDDQGNPNTTPRSPGSIKNHAFFRNVTNSPKAPYSPRAQFYEPKDYDKPSTPKATAFKMPRDYTPRPRTSSGGLPGPPSDVPSPAYAAVSSPAAGIVPPSPLQHHDNFLPAPPTPKRDIPPSPMNVSRIPGSSGVTDYHYTESIADPPHRIRQIGPLPGSPGIKDKRGGPEVIRLAKIGRSPTAQQPPQPVNATTAPSPLATADQEAWTGVDPAMAQTGTYVAKSPKSYMAPLRPQPTSVKADIEEPAQISVLQAVQMLNKAGFNPGKRFNRGFNAKSFKKKKAPPPYRTTTTSTANDNRDSLEGGKPSFVGTRRVAAPTSLVAASSQSINNNNSSISGSIPSSLAIKEVKHSRADSSSRPQMIALETDLRDELEMARDPTPRQMKIQELEDTLRHKGGGPLPPTPRRKKEEPDYTTTRPTPTAQKPPQHFVPSNNDNSGYSDRAVPKESYKNKPVRKEKKQETPSPSQPKKEEKKKVTYRRVEAPAEETSPAPSSRPSQSRQTQSRSGTTQNHAQTRSTQTKKKEKKGFMSGLKKGLGKLKNTVNEIDSQRVPEPTPPRKKTPRREVRMA